jgi:hypothetical protein
MTRRLFSILTLVCALSLTGSAAGATDLTRAAGPLYVAPGGSDSGSCSKAQPCRSFERAYRVAVPGQTVQVAGGAYGGQAIGVDPSKTSPRDVVFVPAPGTRPSIGGSGLTVHGKHIEFRGMAVPGGWYAKPGSADLTFRNLRSKDFFISGARDIRVLGGTVGPGVDYHPIIAPEGSAAPTNILIDGVTFHDWTRSNDSVHTECLQVASPNGFTLRRSRFLNCAIFGLFMTHWGNAGHPKNILIENNVFDESVDGTYAVRFANWPPRLDNVLVRNNSALQPINFDPASVKRNVRVVGNVAPMGGCDPGVAYSYNVWDGARCGATDVNAKTAFRDRAGVDLRLGPGSAAIDRGSPSSFPRTDISGRKRPLGGRPDAGAYETR